MPVRRHVLLEYDDRSTVVYAYRLADDSEQLVRTRLNVLNRLAQARPVNWPDELPLATEGVEYLLLEGIRSALLIARQAGEGQAKVEEQIADLVDKDEVTHLEVTTIEGDVVGTLVNGRLIRPEASEDPEACDRDCPSDEARCGVGYEG